MILLRNIFQPNKGWRDFNMLFYVMIVLITLQSAFAMADSCESSQNNERLSEYYLQFNSIDAELVAENEAALEQEINQDECLDCNAKCCPCCSNNMFTLVSVNDDIKTAVLLVDGIEPTQFNRPYYSFLRPPKSSLGIYIY